MSLSPQMAAILARLAQAPERPPMTLAEERQQFVRDQTRWNTPVAEVSDSYLSASAAGRTIPLRLYRPQGVNAGVIIYAHGGGWTVGNLESHYRIAALLAKYSGAHVLAVDYRLSPEHRFPAAVHDVLAVTGALLAGSLKGAEHLSAEPLVLAGDSAGANLALLAAISMRDDPVGQGNASSQLKGLALLYGCYQRSFDTPSHLKWGAGEYGLTTKAMRTFWNNYCGDAPVPEAEPLKANLAGLPRAFLLGAGCDPLLNDTEALAAALEEAGVTCKSVTVTGVTHAFLKYSEQLEAADETLRNAGTWCGRACEADQLE